MLGTEETVFHGLRLHRGRNGEDVVMKQSDKIAKAIYLTNENGFMVVSVIVHYIGVKTSPDVCTYVHLIAPGAEETSMD